MADNANIINQAIDGSLALIEQEREREILVRRFGLKGKKQTLEQIGKLLGITRERVRQLEKAIILRLNIAAEDGEIAGLAAAEKMIIRHLSELGRVARLDTLADLLYDRPTSDAERAELAFLAKISSVLSVIPETDRFWTAIAIGNYHNEASIKTRANEILTAIKAQNHPMTLDELDAALTGFEHPSHIAAIARISKQLATLNDLWGLTKWPAVNPKNIRDKVYVIMEHSKEPMHFSEIAAAIEAAHFDDKHVTTQAIHNELIKDQRFVLIGRGTYALANRGYKRGSVSDVIVDILRSENKPMTRENIIRAVTKIRRVKETTILLNLQNKTLFERIDKNSFRLKK